MEVLKGGQGGSEYDPGVTVRRLDHLTVHDTAHGTSYSVSHVPCHEMGDSVIAVGGECHQCGIGAGDRGLYMCDVCGHFYCPSCKTKDHDKPGHEKLKPLIARSKFKVLDGNQD